MGLWCGKHWKRIPTWMNTHEPYVRKQEETEASVLARRVSCDGCFNLKCMLSACEWEEYLATIWVPWQSSTLSTLNLCALTSGKEAVGHQGGLPETIENNWVTYSKHGHCHFCGSAGISRMLSVPISLLFYLLKAHSLWLACFSKLAHHYHWWAVADQHRTFLRVLMILSKLL